MSGNTVRQSVRHLLVMAVACAVSLYCDRVLAATGPVITVNPPVVVVGEIRPGEADFIRALFAIRNTGDAPLRITGVRPGCRCTVAEYDSIIPPGGMGRFLQVVDIHGFPDGPFERSVTVTTNATNQRLLSLPVRGIIRGFVEIETRHLRIPIGGHGSLVRPVVVRSDRSDLRLLEAVFTEDPEHRVPWKPLFQLPVSGTLMPTRYDPHEGLTYYELRLWLDYAVRDSIPPAYCLLRFSHPRSRQTVCRAVIVNIGSEPEWLVGPGKNE